METINLKKAKKANQASSSTSSPKVKKQKATDTKTATVIKEKVAKEKDLMYQYPAGIAEGLDKKKFRAAARRAKASFMKSIANEKDEKKKAKLIKEANTWAHETYSKEHMVDFG